MSEVEWRPVLEFEGVYEACSDGRVRRVGRNELHGKYGRGGYRTVTLSHNGRQKSMLVHTMVAGAFLGRRPAGMVVNHKDHDKTNNRVNNLEYVTQAQNIQLSIDAGRRDHLKRHRATRPLLQLSLNGAALASLQRISDSDVSEIHTSKDAYAVLMRRYRISALVIRAIRKGDVITWG